MGLFYIDLDDFPHFHEPGLRYSGDAALTLAAQALHRGLRRQSARLYRLHGDEFVALLPAATTLNLEQTANRMLARGRGGLWRVDPERHDCRGQQ